MRVEGRVIIGDSRNMAEVADGTNSWKRRPDAMAKEWLLSIAFNRWQLNRPEYLGRLEEAIRACAPKSLEEWEQYYFSEVPQKHVPADWQMWGNTMREHLEEVGLRLYVKISEQLRAEIDAITEEDCIAYVRDMVIRRTYEGVSHRETDDPETNGTRPGSCRTSLRRTSEAGIR